MISSSARRVRHAIAAALVALCASKGTPAFAQSKVPDAPVKTTEAVKATEPPKTLEVEVLRSSSASVVATADPLTVPVMADWKGLLGCSISKTEVTLIGEAWGNTTLPSITSVRNGATLSAESGRLALREILSTGRFARGTVAAERLPDNGCVLRVSVVARKTIDSVRVEMGSAAVDADDLTQIAGLSERGELVGSELADQVDQMESYLSRRGYPDASVNIRTEQTKDPNRVKVILEVAAGEPRNIQRLVPYVVDGKIADSDLAGLYTAKVGDRADEQTLSIADTALVSGLRAKGFHRVKVSHDLVRYGGQIVLRVRIDAGKRYRFGFEGNDHYDDDALAGAIEIPAEPNADASVGTLVAKLKDFYAQRGFLDVEVTNEERQVKDPDVIELHFTIRENRRVSVATRYYPCVAEKDLVDLSESGPPSIRKIGAEIDSFLEEDLPGADFIRNPDPKVVRDVLEGPELVTRSRRAQPVRLDPSESFYPDSYERAIEHLQELYRHEGFLHAAVGPMQVLRQECKKNAKGVCIPIPSKTEWPEVCTYDSTGVPLDLPTLPRSLECIPDPARNVLCADTVTLRIPVRLGPRAYLKDVAFRGTLALSDSKLAKIAGLKTGDTANPLQIEDSRRLITDAYKEEGYAFADVRAELEESTDHSRARARFDIVEGEQVIVQRVVIRGNKLADESIIRHRISLNVGEPFRESLRKKTIDDLSALGFFSSVDVRMADPYVPQKNKAVYVVVTESQTSKWGTSLEGLLGFRSGEGFRVGAEYQNRILLGGYVGFSVRAQANYIPDVLLSSDVLANFQTLRDLPGGEFNRVGGRATARLDFPDIGLGPSTSLGVDAVALRNLQRDYTLTKFAAIPTLTHRASRQVIFTFSQTAENNEAHIFGESGVNDYIAAHPNDASALSLRVPDGNSWAFAQRVSASWDRRDNALNAHQGTYAILALEHVDWSPTSTSNSAAGNLSGHFLRISPLFSGYVALSKKVTFAASGRIGVNAQLTSDSKTYPDRAFYMGGYDTMRAWLQDTFMPQDYVDKINARPRFPNTLQPAFTEANVGLRGGDLMTNLKMELRFPIAGPVESVLFSDIGNLWVDPMYPFRNGFPFRIAVGTGLRFQTPIGPIVFDVGFNANEIVQRVRVALKYSRTVFIEDPFAFSFSIGVF